MEHMMISIVVLSLDGRAPPANLGPIDIVNNNHAYCLPPSHPENPLMSSKEKTKSKSKLLCGCSQLELLGCYYRILLIIVPINTIVTEEDLGQFVWESPSRDEKRARWMSLPISTEDISNLPMDELDERLSKAELTEAQLTLIRDIRRRGKNKVVGNKV
jgi:hypothetical protein